MVITGLTRNQLAGVTRPAGSNPAVSAIILLFFFLHFGQIQTLPFLIGFSGFRCFECLEMISPTNGPTTMTKATPQIKQLHYTIHIVNKSF